MTEGYDPAQKSKLCKLVKVTKLKTGLLKANELFGLIQNLIEHFHTPKTKKKSSDS